LILFLLKLAAVGDGAGLGANGCFRINEKYDAEFRIGAGRGSVKHSPWHAGR